MEDSTSATSGFHLMGQSDLCQEYTPIYTVKFFTETNMGSEIPVKPGLSLNESLYINCADLKDTVYMIESPHDSSSGIASDDHNGLSYTSHHDLDDRESQDSREAESCDSCAERQRAFMEAQAMYSKYGSRANGFHQNRVKFASDNQYFGNALSQKLSAYQQTMVQSSQKPHGSHHQRHSQQHFSHSHSQKYVHNKMTILESHDEDESSDVSPVQSKPPRLPEHTNHKSTDKEGSYHNQGRLTTFKGQRQSPTPPSGDKLGNGFEEVNLDDPYGQKIASTPPRLHPEKIQQPETKELKAAKSKTQDWLNNHKNGFVQPHLQGINLQDSEKLMYSKSRDVQNPKKPKVNYFDLLPDDVIFRIFGNLPCEMLCRCSRVCRRWYCIAWDHCLWTTVRIHNTSLDIDKALKALTKKLSYDTPSVCVMVEKIILNGCDSLTDRGLNLIAKRCPELRQLEIEGCPHVSNIAIFEVVSRCVNIEHLNVSGCENITCISLTPEATVQAQAYGKQIYLRYLDMTDCFSLEDTGLQIISSYCPQLIYLYLRRCSRLSDVGIQYVANYCTGLREFSISDCKRVTDFSMRELSKLGSNLRYLSVAKCDRISDVGVKYVAKHCHKLRYLNVRGCEAVSDDSLELLAQYCPRLKSLDIGKCDVTDDGLEFLAENCPQLKKLSLKSCDGVTDRGIIVLAHHCRHLQQLNIQDCSLTAEAYRTVKKFCKRCIIEHTNPGFY